MKRRLVRGPRYNLSKRYNAILLILYVGFLCATYMDSSRLRYRRDLMIYFSIFLLLLTMLRLYGVAKEVRHLDLIFTCAFAVMLFGCKLNLDDITGFFVVAFIAFLTMTVGGICPVFSGLVALIPCLMQLYEKWTFQKGYWFEAMLGFCLFMMLIFVAMPDSDHSELTFLIFSFLSKAMIIAFVLLA